MTKHGVRPTQSPAQHEPREPWRARIRQWINAFDDLDNWLDSVLAASGITAPPVRAPLVVGWGLVIGFGVLCWFTAMAAGVFLVFLAMMVFCTIDDRPRRRQEILEQRLRAGLCLTCGYDLRETPDRCPECGARPADLCK